MKFAFNERLSDSPYIDILWQTQHEGTGLDTFTSTAAYGCGIVVTRQKGAITVTLRGPETLATPAPVPAEAEFLGIQFRLGTFLTPFPTIQLVDDPVNLPDASGRSFWLNGSAWEFPTYDNAETFVDRLVRAGLLAREPVVDAVMQGKVKDVSLRSVQRRFLRATGLTQGTIHQIDRARQAMTLLQQGVSILDTVDQAGYADQPHMTRSLKRLMGQTPAQIISAINP